MCVRGPGGGAAAVAAAPAAAAGAAAPAAAAAKEEKKEESESEEEVSTAWRLALLRASFALMLWCHWRRPPLTFARFAGHGLLSVRLSLSAPTGARWLGCQFVTTRAAITTVLDCICWHPLVWAVAASALTMQHAM